MNSADIEAAAAAWFARRESGDWNAADETQLESWLDASTAHRIAYVRLAAVWKRLGPLNALGAGVPRGTIPPRTAWGLSAAAAAPMGGAAPNRLESTADADPTSAPRANAANSRAHAPSWRSGRVRAMAALVASLALAVAIWRLAPSPKFYRTPIGTVTAVALADGSKVTLDTNSEIRVALSSAERRIELDHGDAFFEVSKDAARPFVVEVGNDRIVAVGTEFSVRRDRDVIRVLVTEGRVRIERRDPPVKSASELLAAGAEARITPSAVLIDRPSADQIEQLLSWRHGYILLRDALLADAVVDFNRYSARQIVIGDPTIANIRIGGNFRIGNMDAFLWLLQSGFPIHVEERKDRIILTKR